MAFGRRSSLMRYTLNTHFLYPSSHSYHQFIIIQRTSSTTIYITHLSHPVNFLYNHTNPPQPPILTHLPTPDNHHRPPNLMTASSHAESPFHKYHTYLLYSHHSFHSYIWRKETATTALASCRNSDHVHSNIYQVKCQV